MSFINVLPYPYLFYKLHNHLHSNLSKFCINLSKWPYINPLWENLSVNRKKIKISVTPKPGWLFKRTFFYIQVLLCINFFHKSGLKILLKNSKGIFLNFITQFSVNILYKWLKFFSHPFSKSPRFMVIECIFQEKAPI